MVHLRATGDIEDLSAYGLGSANNGGGTDGEELILSGSALAGDHIAVVRSADAIDAYLASDAGSGLSNFASVIQVSSVVDGNGNDAIELFFNGEVIETMGDIEFEGGSGNYDLAWVYKIHGYTK